MCSIVIIRAVVLTSSLQSFTEYKNKEKVVSQEKETTTEIMEED